ncbi:MAG: hypothetical protein ABI193_21195 [Minicystis sp.]
MPIKPSLLLASRWTWFALLGLLLAGRDMCAGGGKRPDPSPPPDAAPDGAMSRLAPASAPVVVALR